jgi:hypothetical protein
VRVILSAVLLIALGGVAWFLFMSEGEPPAPEPGVSATPPSAAVTAPDAAALAPDVAPDAQRPGRCSGDTPLSLGPPLADPPVCTRRCRGAGECPKGWCCFDPQGAADPAHFVCAPPEACAGRVHGTPGRAPLSAPP